MEVPSFRGALQLMETPDGTVPDVEAVQHEGAILVVWMAGGCCWKGCSSLAATVRNRPTNARCSASWHFWVSKFSPAPTVMEGREEAPLHPQAAPLGYLVAAAHGERGFPSSRFASHPTFLLHAFHFVLRGRLGTILHRLCTRTRLFVHQAGVTAGCLADVKVPLGSFMGSCFAAAGTWNEAAPTCVGPQVCL
eukprot:scaffold840_cov344-Pavlova_lutheri.AAC.78